MVPRSNLGDDSIFHPPPSPLSQGIVPRGPSQALAPIGKAPQSWSTGLFRMGRVLGLTKFF